MSDLVVRAKSRGAEAVRKVLAARGWDLRRQDHLPPDYDAATKRLIAEVRPYTLTSHERIAALRQAVTHVVASGVPGAFVECGVWRGGSMLAVARTLLELGVTDRELWLYDTFETMPPPGEDDRDVWGVAAADYFQAALDSPGYAFFPQERIERLLAATGYPSARMHFVKGMVEDTLPAEVPDRVALCRLDTDWYASTAHEMEHLFPRIEPGGVLLVDDYGQFLGCRKAVDGYLSTRGITLLLHRIDMTGRIAVVTEAAHERAVSR